MRKYLRKINVNNEHYVWCVSDYNCDGDGGSRLKIWKDNVLLHKELVNEIITPKIIREKILEI